MPNSNALQAPHDDDEEADHCACDIELADDEATLDAELPPAVGGIETANVEPDDDENVDGCDVDFNEAEPTADEELPVTVGGA
jgi:hypothetical protein